MATFIALVDFTGQGMQAIKESTDRSSAFVKTAADLGCEVRDVFWTSGSHDGVLIFDAKDDRAASALMLTLGKAGNVKTTTLRAYSKDEMASILENVR